jgi:hypothetical protein
MSEVVVS